MRAWTLLVMLLRRELGAGLLAAVAVAGITAVYAADVPPDVDGAIGLAAIAARLRRRFDLTVLAVAAVLVALRAAIRTGSDHSAAWVDVYAAAGGARTSYALALIGAITVQGAVLFLAGAGCFAAAVYVVRGTTELLDALVVLAPAGVLLIAVIAAHTTLIGLCVREPLATLFLAAVLAASPYAAAAAWMARHDPAVGPFALRLWLDIAVPLAVATTPGEAVRQTLLLVGVLGGATWMGGRYAGRRS